MPAGDTSRAAVGASVPKVDGAAKVTGAARYVDDLEVPGALHGRTVRSAVAHATLKAIRLDPGFDWSDVTVVTADDIPGDNYVAMKIQDQPVLVPVGGTIRHVDEPVALVAAATAERAAAAAAAVTLEVEELPAVLSIEDSIEQRVLLHGDDNVFKRFQILRGGDIDEALAACDLVVEGTYRTGAQEQMYIEPQGVVAWWDDDGACRVVGSMQCPYYVHRALGVILGLDAEHTIITQSVTGGGFGGKEDYPSIISAHAALLARKAKAPVKIVYDRAEDIAATTKRHPSRVHHRLGLMRDGTLVACDVDVVLDGGAYATLSEVVLSRAVLHAAGPYNFEHVRIRGRAVATNTPPHGAFRGFGAPQTTFAYERQVAKAARAVGLEPFEMRRKNMLRRGDATATGQVLEASVGSEQVLEAVAARAGEPVTESHGLATAGGDVKRGRGLSFYFHGAGFTGSGEAHLKGRATVATTRAGGFEVRTSSTDIGQGSITMFSQIAATALGVDIDRVSLSEATTEVVPNSGPTVASRTCMVVGRVVEEASKQLRARLEKYAAEQGLGDYDLSDVARSHYAAEGEIAETVTYEPPPGIVWDDATYTGSAYPAYGWAACLVDVAIDLDTYEVTVERCIHAVDVGKAIHPVIVKGQIEGGTLQALGWALWEHVVYGGGRVVNASMTDCIIPTFWDAPELETILIEEPYPYGPHGAKGVGEIPMDGPAAAVAAAVEDALGLPFDELPVLPETIARAAREGGKA